MGTLFRNVYSWLMDFYGTNLYEYFKGWNCEAQEFSNPNLFASIGLITAVIALFFVLLFYYIIDSPRFFRWWSWLIMAGAVALTTLFYGFGKAYSDLHDGKIGDCLLYIQTFDEQGNLASQQQQIWDSNCWGFGMANMIIGVSLFFIFSMILKWWSKSAKYSPFI